MNEFSYKLESLALIAPFPEFSKHVEHIKQMMTCEDPLSFKIP